MECGRECPLPAQRQATTPRFRRATREQIVRLRPRGAQREKRRAAPGQTHVRGALGNGLSQNEIRAVLTQIAIYCGIPVGVDCFRLAKAVLSEAKKG